MMQKRIRKRAAAASLALLMAMLCGCESGGTSSTSTEPAETTLTTAPQEKTEAPTLDGYQLLWNDEFEDEALREDIWSYDPHEPGWTNQELQEYTTSTDNVFIRDGKLVLKAIQTKADDGSDYYTSGKIKSQGKKDFMYGKVVVSAKVPEGQGLWPAIWMMPQDEQFYGQWPKCGEIDIMEVLGNQVDFTGQNLCLMLPLFNLPLVDIFLQHWSVRKYEVIFICILTIYFQ